MRRSACRRRGRCSSPACCSSSACCCSPAASPGRGAVGACAEPTECVTYPRGEARMTVEHPVRKTHPWRHVLAWGLLLWAAATVTLALTEDLILLPSVVLIGSFLVPVATIFWFLEHRGTTELDEGRLFTAFFVAGGLGGICSAAVEIWLGPHPLLPNLSGGGIEEGGEGDGLRRTGCSRTSGSGSSRRRRRGSASTSWRAGCAASTCATGSCSAPWSASGSARSRAPATPSATACTTGRSPCTA